MISVNMNNFYNILIFFFFLCRPSLSLVNGWWKFASLKERCCLTRDAFTCAGEERPPWRGVGRPLPICLFGEGNSHPCPVW